MERTTPRRKSMVEFKSRKEEEETRSGNCSKAMVKLDTMDSTSSKPMSTTSQ